MSETVGLINQQQHEIREIQWRTDDIDVAHVASFYLGSLSVVEDLWLAGGDAADVAVDYFKSMQQWLPEWMESVTTWAGEQE